MQYEASTFGNNNRVSALDWWMKYSFSPDLAVQAGRFILPYSRQFYTHPGNLLFSDLSAADYAFNLQRAVGTILAAIRSAPLPLVVRSPTISALSTRADSKMLVTSWQGLDESKSISLNPTGIWRLRPRQ